MVKKNIIIIRQDWYFDNYRIELWSRIGLKQTNNQSINQSMEMFVNNDESLNKSNQIIIIDLMLDYDKISENGRNIYESNQINQTILQIDAHRSLWNEPGSLTFWRFGISKYYQYSIFRNTYQFHYTSWIETIFYRSYWC